MKATTSTKYEMLAMEMTPSHSTGYPKEISIEVESNKKVFFCDTYALIELIGGNKDYKGYSNHILVTSDFNLMELYYSLLKDYGKEAAERYFEEWVEFRVEIPRYIIKKGMEIKLANKKEKLSYVDCMGYAYALETNIFFLTGDSKFKNKVGVEFVK